MKSPVGKIAKSVIGLNNVLLNNINNVNKAQKAAIGAATATTAAVASSVATGSTAQAASTVSKSKASEEEGYPRVIHVHEEYKKYLMEQAKRKEEPEVTSVPVAKMHLDELEKLADYERLT